MKILSERVALKRLGEIIADFKSEISNYEQRAKSCLTCEVKGSCCLDAHFVNVHISRLEAAAIRRSIEKMDVMRRRAIELKIDETIAKYGLKAEGAGEQTYACPLFASDAGCLVHHDGKPAPCIAHACYENAADLPPQHLLDEVEIRVDKLNDRTYSHQHDWLSIPLALKKYSSSAAAIFRQE